MKQVNIRIEDCQLSELGIEQPPKYTPLRFNESHFTGYWISEDSEEITFYLDALSFICKNTKRNIDIFESILSA